MTSRAVKTAARRRRSARWCRGCGTTGGRTPWSTTSDWCAACDDMRAAGPRSYRDRAASRLLGLAGVLPGAGALPAFSVARRLGTTSTGRAWAHVDVNELRRQATARWPGMFRPEGDQPC